MALNCKPGPLSGLLIFEPDVFPDDRGFLFEPYRKEHYVPMGLDQSFVQDCYSRSRIGTLRGLHYQLKRPQAKLVTALRGRVFDVVVDLRRHSPTFSHWFGIELSEKNHLQLFIPAGFAHGFCVLSDEADFFYKCSDVYVPDDQYGVRWSDPSLEIDWPVRQPVLSQKDQCLPLLNDLAPGDLPS